MLQALGILLFILALVVHEAGHAIAMMRRGIEIEEAGIGFPLGRFKLTLHLKFLPFPVVLSPLLLGAYVKTTESGAEKLKKMSYKDQAVCYGAGVNMNLAFAAVLVIVGASIRNPFANDRAMIVVLISVAVLAVSVFLRRVLAQIMPVLGTVFLGVFAYLLSRSLDSVGGPIAVVTTSVSSTSVFEALLIGGSLSLGLGLLNMLPLVPLDGGKVMSAFFQSRQWHTIDKIHTMATAAVFLVFIVFVIAKDIIAL